ncbi:DUF805 domain-containing protein [uncultured Roseibium sp.]|uniref:DUF805 domain-containing protein n=1 Tax=uncultured Roseibium sp. TaxID=1936171 RepID=UPI0032162282
MFQAADTVLSNYFTFSGRASRSEYWWWMLFVFLTSLVMVFVDALLIAPFLGQSALTLKGPSPASLVTNLLLFFPSITVSVRRLHDIDRSGWWSFIVLVPLIGSLIYLYWTMKGGTQGSNSYGPAPY